MNLDKFNPCPHCKKLNPDDRHKCSWCYRDIPTRGQRLFNATVFWSALAGILGAAYVAYRIGGWS